jgi:hypothetical protein
MANDSDLWLGFTGCFRTIQTHFGHNYHVTSMDADVAKSVLEVFHLYIHSGGRLDFPRMMELMIASLWPLAFHLTPPARSRPIGRLAALSLYNLALQEPWLFFRLVHSTTSKMVATGYRGSTTPSDILQTIQLFADPEVVDYDALTGVLLMFGSIHHVSSIPAHIPDIYVTLLALFDRMDCDQRVRDLALVLVAGTDAILLSREDEEQFHADFRRSGIFRHLTTALDDYDVSDQSRGIWYEVVIIALCHNRQYIDLVIDHPSNGQWHLLNLVQLFQASSAEMFDHRRSIMDALCCLWNKCKNTASKSTMFLHRDILLPIIEELCKLCSDARCGLPLGFRSYNEMYRRAPWSVQVSITDAHDILLIEVKERGWKIEVDDADSGDTCIRRP